MDGIPDLLTAKAVNVHRLLFHYTWDDMELVEEVSLVGVFLASSQLVPWEILAQNLYLEVFSFGAGDTHVPALPIMRHLRWLQPGDALLR